MNCLRWPSLLLLALLAAPQPSPGEPLARPGGDLRPPGVHEVQAAALRRAGLSQDQFVEMAERARWAGLAPDLMIRATHGADDEARAVSQLDGAGLDPLTVTEISDGGLELRAEARWSLSELVYSRHETAIARVQRQAHLARVRLLDSVTRLYFERRRALRRCRVSGEEATRAEARLQMEALTARLDALTGGLFLKRTRHDAPHPCDEPHPTAPVAPSRPGGDP